MNRIGSMCEDKSKPMATAARARVIGAILLVTTLILLIVGTTKAQESMTPLRIGAIVSLSGDAAKNGTNWLQGAQLAVEDLNLEGIACELIVEDDQTRPLRATTAFTKLATVDKVLGVVGGTWDFLAEACFAPARRYRLPFITPTNPVEVLSPDALNNPYVFTNGLSLEATKSAAAKFLNTYKVRSIGLIYIDVPYGTMHADMFKELALENNLNITAEQTVTYEGFNDLIRQGALKVKHNKPELLFTVLNYEGIDLLLRELERLQSSPIVLMPHTLKEAFEFSQHPTRYEKTYGILQDYRSPTFEKRFMDRFGHQPYGYAGPGYDAVQFLVRTLREGIGPDRLDHSFSYLGVTGVHRYPSAGKELVKTSAAIMAIKDGALKGVTEEFRTP